MQNDNNNTNFLRLFACMNTHIKLRSVTDTQEAHNKQQATIPPQHQEPTDHTTVFPLSSRVYQIPIHEDHFFLIKSFIGEK